jgi:hypothetical protein
MPPSLALRGRTRRKLFGERGGYANCVANRGRIREMAFHRNLVSMLRESLPEFVAIAKVAVETPTKGRTSSSFHGFPAAALLFAVADSIGSYYQDNPNFSVTIDGKRRKIDGDGFKHLFIFNSSLYGQTLSENEIQAVYALYRNPLTHNSVLAPGVLLNKGNVSDPIFYPDPKLGIECVNLVGLLAITERAVEEFLKSADSVVPGSRQETTNAKKAR